MSKEKKGKIVVCECGYDNHKVAVDTYGVCVRCGKVLNDKAYFKYNLRTLTRSWKICNCIR